jgi:transcriptional regulator with XRE-family HTH domain
MAKKSHRKEIFVKVKTAALLKVLARKNLSLNGFAKTLRLSNSCLSQFANGLRYPSPRTRDKMLKTLRVEWDEIFKIVRDPS